MPDFKLPFTTRRTVLGSAAALPFIRPFAAKAEETMVLGTWGGDYARLLRENVETPILKPEGITVVEDIGDEDPRVAKMYAQRRLPRGTVDIACLQAVRGHEVTAAGLVMPLDDTKVPNLKHVLPNLKSGSFAPHIYSLQVLIYNPNKVTHPPVTLTDLIDAKYKGKVGVGDGNYFLRDDGLRAGRDWRHQQGGRAGDEGGGQEVGRERLAAVFLDRRDRRRHEIGRRSTWA